MQQDISIQITEGNYVDATAYYEVEQFENEPVQHNLFYIEVELFGMEMTFIKDQLPEQVVNDIINQIELAENENE